MINHLNTSTQLYTDIQGLQQLKANYTKDAEGVKQAIAEQFQSMLMGMMLKSMREANQAFESGLFGSDQMEFYQDMFDKQLSISMGSIHNEFTEAIKRTIDNHGAPLPNTSLAEEMAMRERPIQQLSIPHAPLTEHKQINKDETKQHTSLLQDLTNDNTFNSPKEFVEHLWPMAKQAASTIGVDPKLLIAQAALETNWGKNIISHNNNQSSHNLFNIKATPDWSAPRVRKDTLEQQEGILVKKSAEFRSYPGLIDSFKDYIHFLQSNDRYTATLQHSNNPEAFAHELQKAGYATDKNYADKILKIFSGDTLKQIVSQITL